MLKNNPNSNRRLKWCQYFLHLYIFVSYYGIQPFYKITKINTNVYFQEMHFIELYIKIQ